MKPSMKMGMIALLGICVVFYQYHLSTGVRFDQVTAEFNGRTVVDEPNVPAAVVDSEACSNFHKLTEQAVSKVYILLKFASKFYFITWLLRAIQRNNKNL